MKRWIKHICMGLAMIQVLLLTACGKQAISQTAMGRYIEKALEIGEDNETAQNFMLQGSDGKLRLFTFKEGVLSCLVQKENLSFEPIVLEWSETFNSKLDEIYGYITAMGIDDKGAIYMAVTGSKEGCTEEEANDTANSRSYIFKFSEGEIKTTLLNIEGNLPYVMPKQLLVLDNGDCIISGGYTGILQFNLDTGNLVRSYSNDAEGNLMLKDNKLYVASSVSQGIDIYNLESGQIEENIPCEKVNDETKIFKGEQGIYLMNREGIWHLAEQGAICEQLMEGTGVTLGLPSRYVEAGFYVENQFIAYLMDAEGRTSFKVYTYSDKTPSKPEIELTAYMLEENQTLRETLTAYELTHPEVRVNILQGMNEGSGITKDDAIKALHTELLAGGGPDLLLLDGLEQETYKEKGVLANLEGLDELENIVPQIKIGLQQEIYSVPLRFSVPCLVGSEEVINSVNDISELVAYQEAHPENQIFTAMKPEVLYNSIASLEVSKWLNSEGKLNGEEVSTFLKGIKVLTENAAASDFILEQEDSILEALDIANNKAQAQIWEIKDIWDLLFASDLMVKREEVGLKTLQQEGKACFKPLSMIGVNQNSKNIELAKEIVSFMLQEDNQDVDTKEGFPVRQSSLKKWLAGEMINKDTMMGVGRSDRENLKAFWETRDMIPVFEKALEDLGQAVIKQSTLEKMVLEEAKPYFNNEKSLEEVMAALEPKVALYSEG
ncbi:MAG: hypothetical protein E7231_17970 [Cellulosilyticum sp.]|nr:hypothetical protein [Cellulosilyticum sp.]